MSKKLETFAPYQAYKALASRPDGIEPLQLKADGVAAIFPGEVFCRATMEDGALCTEKTTAFSSSSNLKTHLEKVHGLTLYKKGQGNTKTADVIKAKNFFTRVMSVHDNGGVAPAVAPALLPGLSAPAASPPALPGSPPAASEADTRPQLPMANGKPNKTAMARIILKKGKGTLKQCDACKNAGVSKKAKCPGDQNVCEYYRKFQPAAPATPQ